MNVYACPCVPVYGRDGSNPVVGDSWRFDLSTMVWTVRHTYTVLIVGQHSHQAYVSCADEHTRTLLQAFPSDPLAPAVSHAFVMPLTNSTVILYGGRTNANKLFGRTMVMHVAQGWRPVLPAGARPQRRTGHVVIFDPLKYSLTISHGLNPHGEFLNDTWILDTSSRFGSWRCTAGNAPECPEEGAVLNSSAPASQRPPPSAFAAFSSSYQNLFTFGGLHQGEAAPILSNDIWKMSLSTGSWARVMPISSSKHSFPTDVENYERWDPGNTKTPTTPYNPQVKPSPRQQAASVMISSFAGMGQPLLVLGGSGEQGPLDDIWLIDTKQNNPIGNAREGMLTFDGVDDILSIPLPSFTSTTRSMNGVSIDCWIQIRSSDGLVILWDAMTGDAVVLRAILKTYGAHQYVSLIYYPGDNKETTLKTWGPIKTPGFRSDWHHVAFVLRFAHVSQGSSLDPIAIPVQAFFFIDCMPIPDDGKFLLLDLKSLSLSDGIDSVYVGGPSSRASRLARDGYQYFSGNVDNFRIWWVQCPAGPTKCNPYGFLYPQQDYAPYKRIPASGIQDADVTIDDVAPVLRESMFTDRMPTNTTDLLVSIEADHEDAGGLLIDSSLWLPASCELGKEGNTACDGCPQDCFFDECWKYDVDCFESRLSEDHVKFYAESGSCKCHDSLLCPRYVEACECPSAFDRQCTKSDSSGPCIEWQCVCGKRKKTECNKCILNGNLQIPSDPCLPPGICTRSACVFPFVQAYDIQHTQEGTNVPENVQIETIELNNFFTDMVGKYLDPSMYEMNKMHILNLMEYSCYTFHWSRSSTECTSSGLEECIEKDKRRTHIHMHATTHLVERHTATV